MGRIWEGDDSTLLASRGFEAGGAYISSICSLTSDAPASASHDDSGPIVSYAAGGSTTCAPIAARPFIASCGVLGFFGRFFFWAVGG